MTSQRSFNKVEHELVPQYHAQINAADTLEEVRDYFARTVCALLEKAGGVRCRLEDVTLQPASAPHYALAEAITGQPAFQALWKDSDLAAILVRLAEPAVHRHAHLAKHPEKTNSASYHHQK